MPHSTTNNVVSKITKPTAISLAALTALVATETGAGVVTFDNKTDINQNNKPYHYISQETQNVPDKATMNLFQFSRLYTIGKIPIIDFIIIYIFMYLLNSICGMYNYKLILVAAVPITIIINIITNKNVKINAVLLIILIISMYYLLTMNIEQT
jgi:hypothetical protein